MFVSTFDYFFFDISTLSFNPFFNDPSIMGVEYQKLNFIFSLFLGFFILYDYSYKNESYILLLSIPIFSIVYAPSILIGSLVFFIFKYLSNKNNLYLYFIIFIVFEIVFFIVFYHQYFFESYERIDLHNYYDSNSFMSFFKSCYNQTKHLFTGLIQFFPYFFIMCFYKYRDNIILILLFLFFSIISIMINIKLFDRHQFFTNLLPLILVFTLMSFISFFNRLNVFQKKYIIFIPLLIFFIVKPTIKNKINRHVQSNNEIFLNKIANEMSYDEAREILVFNSREDFYKGVLHWWFVKFDLFKLNMLKNKQFVYTLANPYFYEFNIDIKDYNQNTLKKMPIEIYKKNNPGKDVYDFINEFKIKYLYFRSGVRKKYKNLISKLKIKRQIFSEKDDIFIVLK